MGCSAMTAAHLRMSGGRWDRKISLKAFQALGLVRVGSDFFPRLFPRFLFATPVPGACRWHAQRVGRTLRNVLLVVASLHHPGPPKENPALGRVNPCGLAQGGEARSAAGGTDRCIVGSNLEAAHHPCLQSKVQPVTNCAR